MSILKSTHSGSYMYWSTILKERGYYRNPLYPFLLIHPEDKRPGMMPEWVIHMGDDRNTPSLYVTVGSWGQRVKLIDIKQLELIESYWQYRRDWTDADSVAKSKQLGNQIIEYANEHSKNN